MNEKQFVSKIKTVKKDINNYLEKECLRLYKGEGINTDSFENDFTLLSIMFYI